jgi:hypothetical protein
MFGSRPDCRNHLSSLFLKKFRVHKTLLSVDRTNESAQGDATVRIVRAVSTILTLVGNSENPRLYLRNQSFGHP